MALVAQAEARRTEACRKSQAPGAGDGQGDPGGGIRRPALRCGGDDTAEAGGLCSMPSDVGAVAVLPNLDQ